MIIPTLLTDDRHDAQQKIDQLNQIPDHPTHLQFDVIDGFFADNLTIMPGEMKELNCYGCTFEVHVMANDPDDYLGEVKNSGAQAIIPQIERLRDRADFIKVAKQLNLGIGLALDLYTPVSELSEEDLFHTDIVLLMAVKAGFSHQQFNPLVIDKIKQLRARNFKKPIEIDGGITSECIPDLLQAGASHLAVNSALWHDGAVAANLRSLQQSVTTNK